jgi:hypothetical protein
MSTPTVVPSKLKTWITLIGGLLGAAVPLVLSLVDYLPPQWAAAITAVIGLLTALGVYHAPYTPSGTKVVPDTAAKSVPPAGGYHNPWR